MDLNKMRPAIICPECGHQGGEHGRVCGFEAECEREELEKRIEKIVEKKLKERQDS